MEAFVKKKPLTQQGAFRRDRNALRRAEREGVSDKDLINQMASTHSLPYSPQAYSEASGALIHTRANMNRETPIDDALEAIIQERKLSICKPELSV